MAAAFTLAVPVRAGGPLRRAATPRAPRRVATLGARGARVVATGSDERMLHAVYRVGDLERTGAFLTALGMKLLRSRDIPAEKYANAFYGFGTESRGLHFSLELTYNYGVQSYNVGDALEHFVLTAEDIAAVAARLRDAGFAVEMLPDGRVRTIDPTGYAFEVAAGARRDPMRAVRLAVCDLDRSVAFYEALGMTVYARSGATGAARSMATVGYGDGGAGESATLELSQRAGGAIGDVGDGYGQIAVSTPSVYAIAERMRKGGVAIAREPGPVPGIGTKICAVRDPDGFKVVFVDGDDFEKELE